MQTIRIYSQDIGMEFGIEKSTPPIISGKRQIREGIKLPKQEKESPSNKQRRKKKFLRITQVNEKTTRN